MAPRYSKENELDADFWREFGEMTAAMKANVEVTKALVERLEVVENQLAEYLAARKGLKMLIGVIVFLSGLFGGKLVEWLGGHIKP